MKNYSIILGLILIFVFYVKSLSADPAARQRLLMNYTWKFIQSDVKDAQKEDFDDTQWRTLNLPHDWSVEGEFKQDAPTKGSGGYLPAGIGWYRKHFNLSEIRKGQNFRIEFDGVYMNSDVWINGQHLGNHPNGYTSFCYDLTPYIKKGENIIALRVDNSVQPNSRWYSGSGIYRHVWLTITGPVNIARWGTYITTPEADSVSATIIIRTIIENRLPEVKNIILRSVVKNESGQEAATAETPVTLSPSGRTEIEQSINIASPLLWSVETPTLYTMHSSISEGRKVHDDLITPFGIRKIEYDKDKGFLLNGMRVKMNGVNLHHDAGCLGAAVPEQAWIRRLQILKEMGCNAIRTAHNPPSPEFLDLCDKMGFLVMNEAFDEWEEPKGQIQHGYHRYFTEHSKSDLVSIIHRDRNHPSVVLWSAGNEVAEQATERGQEVLDKLVEIFHKEDPTRPVTVGNDKIVADDGPARLPFLEMQDIVGYNYADRWHERRELIYSIDRHDHPDWKIIGTEDISVRGVRGEYYLEHDKLPSWAGFSRDYRTSMIRAERLWKFTAVHDYVIGNFMWTGIDYLGEAWWPSKNSSSGVIDLCGFPKDGYYFYQSQWTSKPMIHMFPHWNWEGYEGHIIPVIIYTNCDSVELFLNGKSFGTKSYVFPQQGNSGSWITYGKPFIIATTSDLHLSWDVPYEPGILKVTGKKGGKVVCTKEIHTTSGPAAMRLSADRNVITADAQDIVHVKVEIIDENGLVVPTANNIVEFMVEGEGVLAGTDNGNPKDITPMKSKHRSAFNGLALAVIRSTERSGDIRITAVSENLKGDALQIASQKPDNALITVESLK